MIGSLVTRFAAGLRFPTLFKIVGTLFLIDFLVPDLIPFADEILLALGTLRRRHSMPVAGDAVGSGSAG